MSLDPLYVLLQEVSVQVICLFFNWIVCLSGVESCEFFVYVCVCVYIYIYIHIYIYINLFLFFEIEPLSEISLANIFSHTVGSLFILVLCSRAMQKLFMLIKSHLFILSFMSLTLGDISVKILLCGISEIFLPMFSSRTYMVSRLILYPP